MVMQTRVKEKKTNKQNPYILALPLTRDMQGKGSFVLPQCYEF